VTTFRGAARSWVASLNQADHVFSLPNLPYGVFRRAGSMVRFVLLI